MAHNSDTYADRFRKAVSAGKSHEYVMSVLDGDVKKVDKDRLKACQWAIDKCVGNPPTSVVTHESATPPDFSIIHGDD